MYLSFSLIYIYMFWAQVNNVGTSFRKPTVDYTAAEYSTIMTTNLESAYHLCQLAHPLLKASGAGSIVFVSSVAGVVSLGTGSIYAATKGMLLSWYSIELELETGHENCKGLCVLFSMHVQLQ
ncbi:hypothetical protein VitviT2T_019294 [Vitis vinifera]|uniref:Tropinone reductase-like n=1 Tax=Vitis vinifera TaxID=29760 RepID=A0ABY9D0F1_VITVI|nr:hypothetical protein VitviT2T_019294 [Vitis vinifera]